jgi:hypothetical protein
MIHHAAIGKIPGSAVAPSPVYQQHRNFIGRGANFPVNVNRNTVSGDDLKIGALNGGLLCVDR